MSKHDYLNAVEKSQQVDNVRENVKANADSNHAAAHGESWRKAIDVTRADRVDSQNSKSHGSKTHAELQNLNATDEQ